MVRLFFKSTMLTLALVCLISTSNIAAPDIVPSIECELASISSPEQIGSIDIFPHANNLKIRAKMGGKLSLEVFTPNGNRVINRTIPANQWIALGNVGNTGDYSFKVSSSTGEVETMTVTLQ